uniref:Uncharacterized protein n=1 Tax=Lygus hesperus TaxID=30085 RepID=A0A146MF65_LYGHE
MQWKRLIPAMLAIFSPSVFANVTDWSISVPEPDFECESGLVIPGRFVCDGEVDCGLGDGSDERNCSKHESSEHNLSSEEIFVIENAYPKMDQKPLEEGTTVDDNLHEDVSAIGKSWYKLFSRNTRSNSHATKR